MDKEYIYREVLNKIRHLECEFNHHDLHKFLTDPKIKYTQFRLGGKFGSGFMIHLKQKNELASLGQVWFAQHFEDTTSEGLKWISEANQYFKELCEEEIKSDYV